MMKTKAGPRRSTAAVIGALGGILSGTLAGCGDDDPQLNIRPGFIRAYTLKHYDGVSDDLLTGGLGASGLASATAPTLADPLNPTAAELRRLAIYTNYRALVDMTSAGGYGSLYGPQVAADGTPGTGEGRVAGSEYLAFSDDGSGLRNVTLMVQVPSNFNPSQPCLITATSSGSRGVYGAISTGEWGLKRGCAVAYTDKGTHSAGHDLASDTVPLIDGTRASAAAAGSQAAFRATLSAAELAALNAATPDRLAFKHAHSQRNPEKDWGLFTLQAIEFAFYVLNERYGESLGDQKSMVITPTNTLVIASSISNGGAAALAAAELDTTGLIDGVAVAEPALELPASLSISVQRGSNAVTTYGKTLYDYTSYANLFQSCAALSSAAGAAAGAPGAAYVVGAFAANRCTALKAKGLLSATTTAAQADEALARLRAYGWEADADLLHASHAAFEVASAVTVTFGNALARASVKDALCGYSFGATTALGVPSALPAANLARQFATANGVPPSDGVQLINNLSPGAPLRDLFSISPSSGLQDLNADGAACLRHLLSGVDTVSRALQTGIDETRRNGNLRGRPAVIVHGRADALIPVNHSSRPYTALNKSVEGGNSQLSYIEVTNAQHFDGFIGLPAVLPGYDTRFVPLHVYLFRGLDAVYDKLRSGKALPPSQLVRTLPRGGTPGSAPAITALNVPAIAATPAANDAITMSGTTLRVPD
jgi:hydroxybutyrate-dimer hydrolase